MELTRYPSESGHDFGGPAIVAWSKQAENKVNKESLIIIKMK